MKFLLYRKIDGELAFSIMSAEELIKYINFHDCYDYEEYSIYLLSEYGPVSCEYAGWRPNNLIQIVYSSNDELVYEGYGEDH